MANPDEMADKEQSVWVHLSPDITKGISLLTQGGSISCTLVDLHTAALRCYG